MATESAEEVGTGTSGLISGDRIAVDAEEDEGEDAEADEVARNPSDGGFGGGGGGGGPPVDDCCPICFGEFAVACKANCGHWYCGGCILQFWNYSAASRPCKCPMCSASITNLDPEASLLNRQEKEVTEVLREVQRYNRLYVGGARGLVQVELDTLFSHGRSKWFYSVFSLFGIVNLYVYSIFYRSCIQD
ncbi:E3 ubiquitin-protein ligase RNF170 [Linum perenne]